MKSFECGAPVVLNDNLKRRGHVSNVVTRLCGAKGRQSQKADGMSEQSSRKRRLDAVRRAVSNSADSAKDAASDKARSARDATVQGTRTIANSRAAQRLSSAGDSVAGMAKDVAVQGSELAGTAAARGSAGARSGVGIAKERVPWDSVLPDDAGNNLLTALNSTRALSSGARQSMVEQITSMPNWGQCLG